MLLLRGDLGGSGGKTGDVGDVGDVTGDATPDLVGNMACEFVKDPDLTTASDERFDGLEVVLCGSLDDIVAVVVEECELVRLGTTEDERKWPKARAGAVAVVGDVGVDW